MDSLHLVHVKLLAADLLSLTVQHTSPPSFVRCGRTVARVELVGVVVSRDRKEKFLRFLVDDGTGCVPCVLWLNHQYINANSSSRTLDSDPTAEMALKMSEVVRLGTLLRVRGRIVMYRGAIQIAVRDMVLEKDPNVESCDDAALLTVAVIPLQATVDSLKVDAMQCDKKEKKITAETEEREAGCGGGVLKYLVPARRRERDAAVAIGANKSTTKLTQVMVGLIPVQIAPVDEVEPRFRTRYQYLMVGTIKIRI